MSEEMHVKRKTRGVGVVIVGLATALTAEALMFAYLTIIAGRWPGDLFSVLAVLLVAQVGLWAAYRYWHASEFNAALTWRRPAWRLALLAVVLLATSPFVARPI
jgi:hypothetical protein